MSEIIKDIFKECKKNIETPSLRYFLSQCFAVAITTVFCTIFFSIVSYIGFKMFSFLRILA